MALSITLSLSIIDLLRPQVRHCGTGQCNERLDRLIEIVFI